MSLKKSSWHVPTFQTLTTKAALFMSQKDFANSLLCQIEALELLKKEGNNTESLLMTKSLDSLASQYSLMGNQKNALRFALQSLEMKIRLYESKDHIDVASAYFNVADIYFKQTDYDNGVKYQLSELTMRKRLSKSVCDKELALLVYNVGVTYSLMGKNGKCII